MTPDRTRVRSANEGLARWSVALLWSGLLVGVHAGVVTPMLVPQEPTSFELSEHLVFVTSCLFLAGLYVLATSGRTWPWLLFLALFLVNLPTSLSLGPYLLAVAGPFGATHIFQVTCQVAALLLFGLSRLRARHH